MDTKFGWRNFRKATMLVIGFAFYGFSQSSGLLENSPAIGEWKQFGIVLSIIFTFGAILWHFMDMQNAVDFYKNEHPNIVSEDVLLEKPFSIFYGNLETKIIVERYYLVFRNVKDGKHHKLIDTSEVHASVKFFDKNLKFIPQLSHEAPFWLGSKAPYETDRTRTKTIIEASGKPQGLHLVARKQGDGNLYVFSEKSYNNGRKSFEAFREELQLKSPKYFICVELRCGNSEIAPVWISLSNRGAEKEPKFEKLSGAPKPATQQSVHLTGGILRRFQAFFKPRKNPVAKRTQRPPASR